MEKVIIVSLLMFYKGEINVCSSDMLKLTNISKLGV